MHSVTIITECNKDLYLGYKVGDAAGTVPCLAYLSIQLLIQKGRNTTFNRNLGVRSECENIYKDANIQAR